MKRIVLTLILILCVINTSQAALLPDQTPAFTSSPAEGLTEVASNVTLIWETSNANGLNYSIFMSVANTTDQMVDADVVVNNEIRFRIFSPGVGTYLFSVALEFNSDHIWNNVTITFDNIVEETSQTSENNLNYPWSLWFIPFIGIVMILRRKIIDN